MPLGSFFFLSLGFLALVVEDASLGDAEVVVAVVGVELPDMLKFSLDFRLKFELPLILFTRMFCWLESKDCGCWNI